MLTLLNEDNLISLIVYQYRAILEYVNPRLTKVFFVTRLTRGVVATSALDFPNQTPYEIGFGINR